MNDAVSSVVSAVLVFSLFSTAFLLWTLNEQPEWIADREHNQVLGVHAAFGNLQSGLDRLSAADEVGPVTQSLKLAASPLPLLQRAAASGDVSVTGSFDWQASFTNPALYQLDDITIGTPSAPAGTTTTDIATLRTLELSLTSTGINGNNDAASITATANDGTQTASLTLRHAGAVAGCPGSGVLVETTGPLGTRARIDFCEAGTDLTDHRIQALDAQFGFKAALSRLDSYTITVTTSASGATASGAYAASWIDPEGRPQVAGDGLLTPGYAIQGASTPLVYDGSPFHHRAQSVHWEGGGILVEQADGQAMVRDPAFLLGVDGSQGYLRWTLIESTGSGSAAGAGTASVQVAHESTRRILMQADAATFTLDSQLAAGWTAFFNEQATLTATGDASATQAGDVVTFNLNQGTVTTWLIELRIVTATITVA